MSPIPASHETLEHTSELRVRLRAPDLGALFREAARALGETLAAQAEGHDGLEDHDVEVVAPDLDALLVDWLNELLYLAETRCWIPRDTEALEASHTRVRGRVRGTRVPIAPSLVKAATHHGLHVTRVRGGYEAEVVFDI